MRCAFSIAAVLLASTALAQSVGKGANPEGAPPGNMTNPAAATPSATNPPADVKALVEGQMPDAPARALVQAKCTLCHTGEYVTMQRLTEKQWQGTVEKMRKFGSPASDEDVKAMVAYLSQYWKPDLPPQRSALSAPPAGSVPRK